MAAPFSGRHACQAGRIHINSFWRLERMLWPIKITNAGIPSYVIPIKPHWAMHLFDEDIASQDLFGAKADLFFRGEKVYYKNGKPAIVSAPGRILWYVSKDKNFGGSGAIRAASMIDEVAVGKPKDIFRKFRRLGIYEWKDVSAYEEVLGIRFSRTELFSQSVSYATVRKILGHFGTRSTFQSATPIPDSIFAEIYKIGTEVDD